MHAESLLSFRERGQGPVLVILHGLFGSGRNWGSMARLLSPHFRVILPDLRNHGQSFDAAAHNYQVMAQDLKRLLQREGISHFHLLGHSMGGKVAMRYAFEFPEDLLHLCVLDITPKAYPSQHHRILLQALLNLDLASLSSRADADQALRDQIPEQGVRQFLLSNLVRSDSGWQWQINLSVLLQHLEEITAAIGLPDEPFRRCPVHFIQGERSDYLTPQDLPLIQTYFPEATLDSVPDAGHWVQADNPQALFALLCERLL